MADVNLRHPHPDHPIDVITGRGHGLVRCGCPDGWKAQITDPAGAERPAQEIRRTLDYAYLRHVLATVEEP